MAASITLTNSITMTAAGTVKLQLTVSASGISPKVFAIEVFPKSADDAAPVLRFSHVCSPAELIEFPEDEPLDNCYFRTDDITMIFDTAVIAESVLSHVKHDIRHLAAEYNALDDGQAVSDVSVFS